MKKQIAFVKNYVVINKTKLMTGALIVTTSVAILSQAGLRQHDKFLKDHNLYNEYYTPDMDN